MRDRARRPRGSPCTPEMSVSSRQADSDAIGEPLGYRCLPASSLIGSGTHPFSSTSLRVVRPRDSALVEPIRRPHLEAAHAERTVDDEQRLAGSRFPRNLDRLRAP